MKVICPKCQTEQEYVQKQEYTKRCRKRCIHCKKTFEVTMKVNAAYIKQRKHQENLRVQKKVVAKTPTFKKIDNYLIQQIVRGNNTQQKILDNLTIRMSRSTISRHLKCLINEGLLVKTKRYPLHTIYSLKDPEIEDKGKLTVQTVHNICATCHIREGEITPIQFEEQQMTNWVKRHFKINDVNFQLTPKSLIFWPEGIGKTTDLAEENLVETAMKIKHYFEASYNCKLSYPRFRTGKEGKHYVPRDVEDESELEQIGLLWTDKSHPNQLETNNPLIAQKIADILPNVDKIQQEITEIKKNKTSNNIDTRISEMTTAFNNLCSKVSNNESKLDNVSHEVAALNENLTKFVNLLSNNNNNSNSNNIGPGPSAPPGPHYI